LRLRHIHILIILGLIGVFAVSSCSTKKNKWNRRVFHNITGHYNAYFNGNESLKEAIKDIASSHKDDYTEVLDVFQLGTTESALSSAPKLDRSITKASLVIHKHSMYFKKKEEVKWVYYSYLMMGKAKFYKHDYGAAKMVFQFITTKYPKENVKEEALLWIALIESIQENYNKSISLLDGIKGKINKGQISKESYIMLPKVYADVYLRQKNYAAAIPYLREAANRAKKKPDKARSLFILAQVEQKQNKLKPAIQHYLAVLKNSPTYIMDFNARMNMARCYEGGDSRVVIKQLKKMLKSSKNEEYQDQIYYALAEIALKEKDKLLAIKYLKLSVAKSINNEKQKAFSALKLAEIYFDGEKYLSAQSYYDSTMLFLPKDYFEYDKLKYRKDVLTELVNNLIIIQTQDSLQTLANMSERQRNTKIDGYIKDKIEKDKRDAELERQRQEQLRFLEENRQTEKQLEKVTQKGAPKWYFYNANSVSSGYTEFITKWGRRKLVDNWRLSDKTVSDFEEEEADSENIDTASTVAENSSITNPKSRDYYLKDVPLTPALMDSSNAKVEQSLFTAAIIYKEKLKNRKKAIETFDELLRRFPKGKYTDQVYYNLYRIYINEGNRGDASFYKKKLIKEYPDSEYTKILLDPDYFKKLLAEANKVKILYKETYELYVEKEYAKVQEKCAMAKQEYPENKEELAKFEMLNALCVGVNHDTLAFITALEVVIRDYPNSEVKPIAVDIIASLKAEKDKDKEGEANAEGQGNEQGEESAEKEESTIFVHNSKETHMFLVLADKRVVKISEMKNRISDHNKKYFGTENLTVSAIPINENVLLIGVSNFKDEATAKAYLSTTKRNSLLYILLKKNGGNFFIISEGNYTRLYRSKDLEGYRKFYAKIYPKG